MFFFSVEKARDVKFHKTPDGEKVPMKALQEFMMNLRDRVPAADAGMKKPVKHNVGLIRHGLLYKWTELLYLSCPHEADLLTLIMSQKLTQYL